MRARNRTWTRRDTIANALRARLSDVKLAHQGYLKYSHKSESEIEKRSAESPMPNKNERNKLILIRCLFYADH